MSGNALLNDPAVVDTSARGTLKGNIVVGRNGGSQGTWTLEDNATANIRRLQVGDAANAIGTVNINGNSSVVASEDFHIGQSGNGTVNVNGGSLSTVSGWLQVGVAGGVNPAGNGTLNVAAGSVSAREFRIGVEGTGVVNVTGGSVTATQQVTVGAVAATGNGTFNVGGTGTANFQNGAVIGGAGVGNLFLGDTGTINGTGTFIIGNAGANAGTASVAGGNMNVNGEMWVGQGAGGNGTLSINAGTVAVSNWLAIGREGGTGLVNLSETGSLIKQGGNHVVIGSLAGNGTFNQSGGTYNTMGAGETRLGESVGGQGVWNISGGSASTEAIRVGWTGGGSGNLNIADTATVHVGAGGLIVSEGGNGQVIITGGTTTIDGDINMSIGTSTGTFIMDGGTLDLTNGNVNFGPGTSSFAFTSGVLRGVANFNRAFVQGGGTIEVGGIAGAGGVTTINGDFTQDSGVLTWELLTGFGDTLQVNGAVSVVGNLDLAPTALAIGDTFTILQNDGIDAITGEFVGRPNGLDFSEDGYFFRINYDGGDGNDVVVEVVPEPSTALAILGGMGVLAMRRRRKS
jgi:autotransporter family porin